MKLLLMAQGIVGAKDEPFKFVETEVFVQKAFKGFGPVGAGEDKIGCREEGAKSFGYAVAEFQDGEDVDD